MKTRNYQLHQLHQDDQHLAQFQILEKVDHFQARQAHLWNLKIQKYIYQDYFKRTNMNFDKETKKEKWSEV
mgnify:CR=1 FL=1